MLYDICPESGAAAWAGCRLHGINSESCSYDIIIFDDNGGESSMQQHKVGTILIHHIRWNETHPAILLGCLDVKILRDDAWSLAPFLANIREKRDVLASACVRDNAAAAVLCSQRALQEEVVDDASCWQKCATTYLADAALISSGWLSPSHALDGLRRAQNNAHVAALVAGSLGVERATPSILERMTEAVAGLSDMAGSEPPDIVRFRASAMQQDGRLADCYYYLCRAGREAVSALGEYNADQTVMYASRICLDAVRDMASVRRNALAVRKAADQILNQMAGR